MAYTEKQKANIIPPKKGEIRNPKGRGKGVLNSATIIKKWLAAKEKINNPITGKSATMTQMDAITLAQIARARKGNTLAFNALLDRSEGKAVTPVNMNLNQPIAMVDKSPEELLEIIRKYKDILNDD